MFVFPTTLSTSMSCERALAPLNLPAQVARHDASPRGAASGSQQRRHGRVGRKQLKGFAGAKSLKDTFGPVSKQNF